jgi:hypothetical protein
MAGEKVLMFFFSPKISEMRLGRWCGNGVIHNCLRCSNTFYMYDMDVGCSLKGFTASTIA